MLLRATLVAAVIATAALAMAGLGPALGHADPNQTCTPPQLADTNDEALIKTLDDDGLEYGGAMAGRVSR